MEACCFCIIRNGRVTNLCLNKMRLDAVDGVLLAWNSVKCVLQHVMVRLVSGTFLSRDAYYVILLFCYILINM